MKLPIYMDYHATTPVDPRVVQAMLPYFTETFGNAASRNHVFGWRAEEAVAVARQQVAELIGASPREIVFTSGATESDNVAIKGVAEASQGRGDHIVTCTTEHKAVLDCCQASGEEGAPGELSSSPLRWSVAAGGGEASADRQNGSGVDHVRQQRDWNPPGNFRNRTDRSGARDSLSCRCRPGRRQDSSGCRRKTRST